MSTRLEKLTAFGRQVTGNCGLTPEQVAAAFGRTYQPIVLASRGDSCMTTEQREQLFAKRREGMTVAAIAVELGLKEGTCKAVLRRAGMCKAWKKR